MDFGGISLPVPHTEESQGVTGSWNTPLGPCKKCFHIPHHFWQFNSELCGQIEMETENWLVSKENCHQLETWI